VSCAFGAKGGACLTGCYKGAGCKYVTSGRYGRQVKYEVLAVRRWSASGTKYSAGGRNLGGAGLPLLAAR